MSSPPSIESLKLSSSSPTKADRPSSPSADEAPNGDAPTEATAPSSEKPTENGTPNGHSDISSPTSLVNGASDANGTTTSKDFAAVPAKSNGAAPPPTLTTASRPAPTATASTPAVPAARAPMARPGVGGGRGGMQAPMGMRGRGGQPMQARLPPSLQAKMEAAAARGGPAPSPQTGIAPNPSATSMAALLRSQALGGGTGGGGGAAAGPAGMANALNRPGPASGPLGLAARRGPGGMARPTLGSMATAPGGMQRGPGVAGRRMGPPGGLNLSSMGGGAGGGAKADNKFTDFNKIMDPSGSLKFSSKAVLTAKGVEFEDGASFKINMDEMEIVGELGKGNYGSVQQVYHRPSEINMAMKEIRLELDESKLNGIIMELDVLHRAVAPEIVEFYGAFTIESCVYYCMEYMDAGSLDTLTGGGVPLADAKAEEGEEGCALRVPEPVLRRITAAMVRGLKFLKDELQIMHRDVKPTNVLINKKGEVKLVDFGVSGQLEKSLAKTNIGCQSYMAPERIKGESQNQPSTYTVSSDVWSVGLSIIELAKGCYPFPPETFANVFAQLQAIVYGPAPTLPPGYSADAQDFVAKCLIKDANGRPTYAQLLEHPFLAADKDAEVDMAGWVAEALERRAARGVKPLAMVEA